MVVRRIGVDVADLTPLDFAEMDTGATPRRLLDPDIQVAVGVDRCELSLEVLVGPDDDLLSIVHVKITSARGVGQPYYGT
jgi:hypothetical protein